MRGRQGRDLRGWVHRGSKLTCMPCQGDGLGHAARGSEASVGVHAVLWLGPVLLALAPLIELLLRCVLLLEFQWGRSTGLRLSAEALERVCAVGLRLLFSRRHNPRRLTANHGRVWCGEGLAASPRGAGGGLQRGTCSVSYAQRTGRRHSPEGEALEPCHRVWGCCVVCTPGTSWSLVVCSTVDQEGVLPLYLPVLNGGFIRVARRAQGAHHHKSLVACMGKPSLTF